MAEEAAVIACHTQEEWDQQFQRTKESKKLVIVDFTASWCPPCQKIAPIFAELAKKFTDAFFLKVDVDELKDVAQKFDITAMPTFIFLKEGNVVDKLIGANKDDLPAMIAQHQ